MKNTKKNTLFEKAVILRKDGNTLLEIAKSLNIAKSTASGWLQNIEIGNPAKQLEKKKIVRAKAGKTNAENYRQIRRDYQQLGKNKAKEKDVEHIKGCMLYWCEGNKNKNAVGFANTDSNMILYFKNFLIKYFELIPKDIVITTNCYLEGNQTEKDIKNYWLNLLDLPESSFKKSVFKKEKTEEEHNNSFKKNRHEYGVCTLYVCKTKVVQHIFGAIQEYMNIDKPEWLA